MIEQHVPEVSDRQVQLADGFSDLRGRAMVTHQPQRCFEREPRREQPIDHDIVHARGDAVVILYQAQGYLRRVACYPGRLGGSIGSSDTAAVPDGWYLGALGLIIASGPTSLVQATVTAYHFARVIGPSGGMMALELVPLCTLHIQLKPPIVVGAGCAGRRVIVEVASVEVKGDRLRGEMVGAAAADWLLIGPEGTATPDIRAALRTDDGAIIFMQYNGKMTGDWSQSPQLPATIYVAPRFETCDERYLWLNRIQAIGKGTLQEDGLSLDYEWYEVR